METERERTDDTAMAAIIKDLTVPELIVVPEPDPALYGRLLLDRAMARARLVPLGE